MLPLSENKLADWLRDRAARKPEEHDEVERKLDMLPRRGVALEAVGEAAVRPAPRIVLEAIVKEYRPVLNVEADTFTREGAFIDPRAEEILAALEAARPRIEAVIPLVGRIDVSNSFRFDYVGTGWLIAPDIAVTNRHVARLIANQDNGGFRFALNHDRQPLDVSLNYRRELKNTGETARAFKVSEVIFIETNEEKADIAFLRVARQPDGGRQTHLELADGNARKGDDVCVIGYPALSNAAPDPDLMNRIFQGIYNVKRLAPGEMTGVNGPSATHDCTTLGGNSGSVVVALTSGKVVALHFAGAFAIDNYAVPVSVIADYKKRLEAGTLMASIETGAPPAAATGPLFDLPGAAQPQAPAQGAATFTVPLTITVTLGSQTPVVVGTSSGATAPVGEAALALRQAATSSAVRAVRPGFLAEANGELTDQPCVQILASPSELDRVRREAPSQFQGHPVVVREAGPFDLVDDFTREVASTIAYDDDNRTGTDFSFEPVDGENVELLCHVGPERSWITLEEFLDQPERELVTSIYEFHAPWIADKIKTDTIRKNKIYSLVMDRKSRDAGHADDDSFERQKTFAEWDRLAHGKFQRIYVPTGNNGLAASSYHIKVTVKDGESLWLSSGNWRKTSQPAIADEDANDSAVTLRSGNREWHVVAKNKTLAKRFRSHILQDLKRCGELGGEPEAAAMEEEYVDVPIDILESIELEAATPVKIIEPKSFKGKFKIEPLLTPDKKGDVYCEAMLRLIDSAKSQLLFQIPYITAFKGGRRIEELADALAKKSKTIEDCRLILRRDNDPAAGAQDLKGRGMNVKKCVRAVGKTHTKGMVVDGKRVMIGSHNWSSLGVTLNRDASLIVHDEGVAHYFRGAFETDWERAKPVTIDAGARAIRPAVGNEAPPGYRRVRLSEVIEG